MSWTTIPDSDVDAESPLTESLAKRWRDNPEAVAEGHVSVPYGKKILVPAALRTSETSLTKFLTPDGVGGTQWTDKGALISSLRTVGVAGVSVVLNPGPGPYEHVILNMPIDPAREYLFIASALVDSNWISGVAVNGSAVSVGVGNALLSQYPFPVSLGTYFTNPRITVEVVGGNLRMMLRITNGPYGPEPFTIHSAQFIGLAL